MKIAICLIGLLYAINLKSQDSVYLQVHFLYGSKPKYKCRKTEDKWFGGKLGGHVGIGLDSFNILSFVPNGRFHIFTHARHRHSRFAKHRYTHFYEIMGGTCDSNKKAIVYIPISAQQKMKFDSLKQAYIKNTPYDYAFIGMRCGAVAYDMLACIGVLPVLTRNQMIYKVFYPKKLRKLLFQYAVTHKWIIKTSTGSHCRNWEMD